MDLSPCALFEEKKRMEFCISLIAKKIKASLHTLKKAVRRSDAWGKAKKCLFHIDASRGKSSAKRDRIACTGANAAAAYFRTWRGNSY
jgi:CRISPR/Cas system-associated endonuclease Cas1